VRAGVPHSEAGLRLVTSPAEGGSKRRQRLGYVGIGLKPARACGRLLAELTGCLVLKPYWGKPAVRNFREGAGDMAMGAGLRPLAKAWDSPPDPKVHAPVLYPTGGGWGVYVGERSAIYFAAAEAFGESNGHGCWATRAGLGSKAFWLQRCSRSMNPW
jgi:hypothetical protein